jgi:L-2,4-diaminobutyrate transaminase
MTMTNIAEIADMDRRTVLHPLAYLKDYASGDTDPTIIETSNGVRIRTRPAGSTLTALPASIV